MDLLESSTQSFIVKIWIEETAEEAGQVTWRGHITHALSGERCYFETLDDILIFIKPYLQEIGILFMDERPWQHWWRRWQIFRHERKLTRSHDR